MTSSVARLPPARTLAPNRFEVLLAWAAMGSLAAVLTAILRGRADWARTLACVGAHRANVQIMVSGALLVAGFFTFPFGRLLGRWLFG